MARLPSQESLEKDLKKREQELKCLYRVSLETGSDNPLEQTLQNSAEHLRQGLQYPDTSRACIRLDGMEYSSGPVPVESITRQSSADMLINREKRGNVGIYYRDNAEYLKEEEELVREVASLMSKALERREMRAELKQYAGKPEKPGLERWNQGPNDLFEKAPTPLLIARVDGDIVRANPAFYKLLDYPADGSVELNFVRDRLYENPAVRAVIYQKLLDDGVLDGLELNLLDRSGRPVPVLVSYVFIDLDGERLIESVYKDIRVLKELEKKLIQQNENLEKSVRDRTRDLENQKNLLVKKNQELVAMSEKLREHKTRLQTLFKAITDTVIVIDPDFNILMSNQKQIGSRGKCYKKVFGQEERCQDCLMERVFLERTSITHEKVVGDEYYLLQAYPIFDAECNITGALEISRIITKEKNMERQLLQADKLASLGQLVSGIGHEINNPNTFIRGNLFIVQEAMKDIFPILDDYHRSHPDLRVARLNYDVFRQNIPVLIDDMVEGANRIKGIVEGLRKFGKRDEGFLNEIVNLNLVTESCLRLVDNQIRRTADVKVDLQQDLPTVMGNAQKLQQVILNMLINASQAIDKPRGTLKVTTRLDGKEVQVRVKDNGKGIDEKTIGQIFDPFFTTKRNQGGTGLGLSIAYGIIKEHKGRIGVVSEVGVGTTFCIYLPVAGAEG
ncbi:MAG: ATP-binding protein [Syntrophorhabdales bacterium]|jgi:signal transduction histidine kinase/PAS domain-containing protein